MTDTAPRPAATRGRGSARGGRGGSRGVVRHRDRQPNGDHSKEATAFDDSADQGEIGEMKKQYSSQLSTLKELFSDWTDVDLLFALQETDGDLNRTIEHISEGHVSQFSDVKKTKDRVKPKAKDQSMTSDPLNSSRSARGRGSQDPSRGARGRTDRGRGGIRGSRGGNPTNGVRTNAGPSTTAPESDWAAPTTENTEKTASEAPQSDGAAIAQSGTGAGSKPTRAESVKPTAPAAAAAASTKTWAQMFAKPVPVPTAPKAAAQPAAPIESAASAAEDIPEILAPEQEEVPLPIADDEPPAESSDTPEAPEAAIQEPITELEPSKDKLTEDNVEHLPDASHPPPTGTAASTVDSASRGPDSATPSLIGQTTHQVTVTRPVLGGFATTAFKATAVTGGRSASFNRRLFEQQEAVVLPGNHAVDRVGVQFGQMGLNGDEEDVDDDREEAETRTQPPQHSPPSQPRASLPSLTGISSGMPPGIRQSSAAEATQEPVAVTKPAPGLPPAPQQQALAQQSPAGQIASQIMAQQTSQGEQSYGQFGRYAQAGATTDHSTASQKPYDPFGQQQSQSAFSGYPSHSQAPGQTQSAQSQLGAYSSAASDFPTYYTADQQRNAYQNYYGSGYSQQTASGQQDTTASQQRSGSAFGAATTDSSLSTSQSQQSQSRYGDNQQSGTTTPNPTLGGQQQSSGAQSQHSQHMHQQPHSQTQHSGAYPYGAQAHAYYNRMDPYYAAYMNQFGYNQAGFGGAGSFGKGGMYGGPQGYGMNPQSGYDQHSSSPANASGFGQSSARNTDTSASGGLGDYARSGSAQPSHSQQQTSGTSAFSGMGEMFGRSGSGFSGQNQGYGQQQTSSQTAATEDSLKPFGDTKTASGASPGSLGQPGRPGSATNTAGQSQGSGLPPPQSQQHAFGGYGGYMNQMQSGQGSQYGGLGGLGNHQGGQGHQTGGYGYGAGFGNNQQSYGRGGWGGNYGH